MITHPLHRDDPLRWAAARAVGTSSQLLVSRLAQASSSQAVTECVRAALTLLGNNTNSVSNCEAAAAALGAAAAPAGQEDIQQLCLQQLRQLQQHAAVLGWPALRDIFFQDQFETWASVVLSVAAGEWLPKLPQGADREGLWAVISQTFTDCPAWNALSALLGHLSAVTPHSSSTGACVTAVAADTAAELLTRRFLAPSSTGLWELLATCDTRTAVRPISSSSSTDNINQSTSSTTAQRQEPPLMQAPAYQHQQQQVASVEWVQAAAALLAALPDRLHLLAPVMQQAPSTAAVLQSLLQECIHFIAAAEMAAAGQAAQHSNTGSSSSSKNGAAAHGGPGGWCLQSAAVPGAVQCVALLLQKLVTRGHGSAVAGVLLGLLLTAAEPGSSGSNSSRTNAASAAGAAVTPARVEVQSATGDTKGLCQQQQQQQGVPAGSANSAAAAEQYNLPALQQVLLVLFSQQRAAAAEQKLLLRLLHTHSSGSNHQRQQRPQQQDEAAAAAIITMLSPLLQVSQQLRSTLLHKILLGRTVPTASLQLLMRLLEACRPSLLPEAAAVLAQSWCDSSTILHVQVPQQAFMTAALVSCIQQLPRDFLDPVKSPHAAAEAANGTAAGTAGTPAVADASAQAAAALGVTLSPYPGPQAGQVTGLLSSIIQGVSARLGSPSPAIRLQAMRVGRAFAGKLDPDKPMFGDAGPLALMHEELWPGAVSSLGVKYAGVPPPSAAAGAAAAGESSTGEGQQERQGRSQAAQTKPQAAAGCGQQQSSAPAGASSRTFEALARLAEAADGSDSDDDEDGSVHLSASGTATSSRSDAGQQQQQSGPKSPAASTAAGMRSSPAVTSNAAATTAAASAEDSYSNHNRDDDASSVADSEGSASSLVAFDLQEDLAAEQWWGPDGLGPVDSKALGLRTLAAALRKQDDLAGALEALSKVEVLIRAEPDELPVVAPELARSLVHCKAPIHATPAPTASPAAPQHSTAQHSAQPSGSSSEWQASHLPKGLSSSAEVQRQRALVAVLALSPLTSGDTLIAELYSPNLDQHQRMVILDGLAGAAVEMADPRKAPTLALQGGQAAPELLPPAAASARGRKALAGAAAATRQQQALPGGVRSSQANGDGSGNSSSGGKSPGIEKGRAGRSQAAPGLVEASSRVWGKVSLQKQAAAAASNGSTNSTTRTFRNRFAPVAVRWAAALLHQCDVKQQGVDLFGRDSLLLGRLLTVLGTFVEAAAETPAAVPLCAGLLELLKAKEVSGHKEAFVRRSALVAASQVVRHLPPARLAGAMVGKQSDVQDEILVERLQWLMAWAQQVAVSDTDQHSRALAAGCVAWHVELAEGAMAVLEHLPELEGPSLVAGGSNKGAARQGEVQVRMPTMERLVLG